MSTRHIPRKNSAKGKALPLEGPARTDSSEPSKATSTKWVLAGLLAACPDAFASDLREIELRRLFEPTPAELRAEAGGRIFIYEGLRDVDVERAMDEEFKRVESIMFIRIQQTDEKGKARKDPTTGAAMAEDDGC